MLAFASATILAVVVSALPSSSQGIKPKPFEPAPWCDSIFGRDVEADLRQRTVALLDVFEDAGDLGTFETESFYEQLVMLQPSAAEWDAILAKSKQSGHLLVIMQIRAAEARKDWDFGYDPLVGEQSGLDGIFMLARAEAREKGLSGEKILAVEVLKRAIESAKSKPGEKTYFDSLLVRETLAPELLAVTVLRELILNRLDAAADEFVRQTGGPLLKEYVAAMKAGRDAAKESFPVYLQVPTTFSLFWEDGDSPTTSLLTEFVFQTIADKNWEVADELRALAGPQFPLRSLMDAGQLRGILVERRDEEALLFLYSIFGYNDRRTYSFDDIAEVFALRGDVSTLESLDNYLNLHGSHTSPEPRDGDLLRARIYALIHNRRFSDAFAASGNIPLRTLSQRVVLLEDGSLLGQGIQNSSGAAAPVLLALLGDKQDILQWDRKFTDRQRRYLELLLVNKVDGWDGSDAFLQQNEAQSLFQGNANIQLNYFQLSYVFETDHERIPDWYDWIMEKPVARLRYAREWLNLANLKCTGWPVMPLASFEMVSHNYVSNAPALETIGGYIIEDAAP